MKMKRSNKLTSLILCMVLIVAMALGTTGCNGSTGKNVTSGAGTEANLQADSNVSEADSQADGSVSVSESGVNVLGTGSTEFGLTVIDQEGNETQFEIHTDKGTVGEALLELGLIDGEESEYGLYVKTVNGITVDYDTDGVYWAFYTNGEYASSGVDSTEITEGESYSFKVE